MSDNKRYYWLKLKEDFFQEKTTKYLRALPDGDKLLIVYLQMQLMSIKTNGLIKYDRLFPVVEEELALALSEDVNIVKFTIQALVKANIVSILDDGSIVLLAMKDLIGSETASAQRSREYRVNKSGKKALHCNKDATKVQHKPNVEIEIEIEKELELDKEIEKRYILSCDAGLHPPKTTKKNDNVKLKEQAKDIVDYLNAKLSTNYKPDNKKTLELIKARLKDGFTVENFKTVIDKKFFEWGHDSNMCQYLRPVTLFSTKFESYLNQPTTKYMSETDKGLLKFLNSDEEGWG